MTYKRQSHRLAALTIVLGLIGPAAGLRAATVNPQQRVVRVETYGATYGEWSARWWQWVLSIPTAINPILDATGANCDQGQKNGEDDVWFLAGDFGGSATRACTIPVGKPIFFPLINQVAFQPTGGETLLDLRRLISASINNVSVLECTIDGVALTNLFAFRVHSPSFSLVAPPGGLLHGGATDPMVSDGYWLLVSPLPAGQHTIHFHAETTDGFVLDVTYNLTIAS
jgi:hypothetical protein